MSKGISLHIGLNAADPSCYRGWSGSLKASEADAYAMKAIAEDAGFRTNELLTQNATREAVRTALEVYASELADGDLLVLTYSGHGARFDDKDGDEEDGRDESWCLWNGYLLDDELHDLLAGFRRGVRVLVISDSCFSGTITRTDGVVDAPALDTAVPQGTGMAPEPTVVRDESSIHRDGAIPTSNIRAIPELYARLAYRAGYQTYEPIRQRLAAARRPVVASTLLIAACQDHQVARETEMQGVFTAALLAVWRKGTFVGDYHRFRNEIEALSPPSQKPNLYAVGNSDAAFDAQKPFTISTGK